MAFPRVTHVSTYNTIEFADPYKVCNACGGWITGVLDMPGMPLVVPCEHNRGYSDVCPSWGPVDGCACPEPKPHGEPPRRAAA